MKKKDKLLLIILATIIIILFLCKFSLYTEKMDTNPISHHSVNDAEECAKNVILKSNIYSNPKIDCACEIIRNNDYYKYSCKCPIYDKNNNLLQSSGSRILYEEKNTYKLKYNIWINENKWYTGYCDEFNTKE